METYDHYTYCEDLARQLKAVGHTDARPRFFTAFGLEDLYDFEDRLSAVGPGMVLIAVDGTEMDSEGNRADGIADTYTYSVILASSTRRDRPGTLAQAVAQCKDVALQVRNLLLLDPDLCGKLRQEFTLNGIGPIGDGFYGVVLTYRIISYDSFMVEPEYWHE